MAAAARYRQRARRAATFAPFRPTERGAHGKPHDPARALRLFGDRRSPAAQAAGRGTRRVVEHRQLRSVGYFPPDGPAGVTGADRPTAAAGRAELVVARIRHAGRRMAVLRA